jgi:hypothetical protein
MQLKISASLLNEFYERKRSLSLHTEFCNRHRGETRWEGKYLKKWAEKWEANKNKKWVYTNKEELLIRPDTLKAIKVTAVAFWYMT